MEIVKETITKVLTTDKKEIHKGDVCVFNADGRCLTGSFIGISKKGALMFSGVISETEVKWNVMPNSITEIHLADIKILESEED